MASRRVSLVDLRRAVGDGWCAFVRGAVRGEALLVPGGSLGIGGEAFSDMNLGYVFGPEGGGNAIRRFHQLLRERRLPGSIAVLSPAAEEAAEVAAGLGLVAGGSLPFMCAHSANARHVEHEYVVERASDVDGVMDAADVLGDAYEIPPEWVRSLLGPTFPDLPSADVFLTRREGRALAAAARWWASTPWGRGRPIAPVGLRPPRTPRPSIITCVPALICSASCPTPRRSRSMRVWALP